MASNGGKTWNDITPANSVAIKNECLGGSHSAKLLLYSVAFNDFKTLPEKDDWKQIESMLSDIAKRLEIAGADFETVSLFRDGQHWYATTYIASSVLLGLFATFVGITIIKLF
ncbi:MAG: hypothetical protein M3352_09130 [Bacteroidota bacterium]|nr:hypothetical protein [Bacteroidota bacterium]